LLDYFFSRSTIKTPFFFSARDPCASGAALSLSGARSLYFPSSLPRALLSSFFPPRRGRSRGSPFFLPSQSFFPFRIEKATLVFHRSWQRHRASSPFFSRIWLERHFPSLSLLCSSFLWEAIASVPWQHACELPIFFSAARPFSPHRRGMRFPLSPVFPRIRLACRAYGRVTSFSFCGCFSRFLETPTPSFLPLFLPQTEVEIGPRVLFPSTYEGLPPPPAPHTTRSFLSFILRSRLILVRPFPFSECLPRSRRVLLPLRPGGARALPAGWSSPPLLRTARAGLPFPNSGGGGPFLLMTVPLSAKRRSFLFPAFGALSGELPSFQVGR